MPLVNFSTVDKCKISQKIISPIIRIRSLFSLLFETFRPKKRSFDHWTGHKVKKISRAVDLANKICEVKNNTASL